MAGSAPGQTAPAPKAARPRVQRFPLTYGEPATTPFCDVEVKPGAQTLNFDVKTGRRRA